MFLRLDERVISYDSRVKQSVIHMMYFEATIVQLHT